MVATAAIPRLTIQYSTLAGDQHPWSVGFFNHDFREYRRMTCRFADEGGILGPTSLPTMLACLPDRDGEVMARSRLFIPMFSQLRWSPPRVEVLVHDGRATFHSPTFAWGVCLDLAGERWLADNLFDVYPDFPHVIPWNEPDPPRIMFVGNLAESGGT